MRREVLRATGIGAAAVILCGGLFLTCFERRSGPSWVSWSRDALANPYLASAKLLEQMGHEVRILEGPGELLELPPTDGTVLVPVARRTWSDERSQDLLDWADRGGHLVVVTYTLWDVEPRKADPLLDRFGLRQYQHPESLEVTEPIDAEWVEDDEEVSEALEDAAIESTEPSDSEEPFVETEEYSEWDTSFAWWPGRAEPLEVEFDWRFHLIDMWGTPTWEVKGEWGSHAVNLRHGRGWITALTDEVFLRTQYIGDADHAEFLVRIARLNGGRGPVWFVIGESLPGLWSEAREHAMPALVALSALVCAWLWRASRRFGPLQPPPAAERRRWLEHLEAVGRYLWREDGGRSLLRGSRIRVDRALQVRHPRLARLPGEARAERLAEWTGLSPDQVAKALDADFHPTGEAAFVAAVAHLERIRSSL